MLRFVGKLNSIDTPPLRFSKEQWREIEEVRARLRASFTIHQCYPAYPEPSEPIPIVQKVTKIYTRVDAKSLRLSEKVKSLEDEIKGISIYLKAKTVAQKKKQDYQYKSEKSEVSRKRVGN